MKLFYHVAQNDKSNPTPPSLDPHHPLSSPIQPLIRPQLPVILSCMFNIKVLLLEVHNELRMSVNLQRGHKVFTQVFSSCHSSFPEQVYFHLLDLNRNKSCSANTSFFSAVIKLCCINSKSVSSQGESTCWIYRNKMLFLALNLNFNLNIQKSLH